MNFAVSENFAINMLLLQTINEQVREFCNQKKRHLKSSVDFEAFMKLAG